ncbi:MAG: phosphoribosyltransferase [Verrucomicrobia bacterium]|nr:phosphoribosyltransferase [Verrucomicrobiota bacterium]
MTFASRHEAGEALGRHLTSIGIHSEVVLGLPRGGVVVAEGVAQALRCPLDVLVVRKIGHPRFREFAVGALAEASIVVLDDDALKRSHIKPVDLEEVIEEESFRLADYLRKFTTRPRATIPGKRVLVVDDGLATGATTEAAVRSAKQQGAAKVLLAVPVASESGFQRLTRVCDQVIALEIDPGFEAVGHYYRSFSQTTDDEVMAILASQS